MNSEKMPVPLKQVHRTFTGANKTVGMILFDFYNELNDHYNRQGVPMSDRKYLTRSTYRRLAKKLKFPVFEKGEWRLYNQEEYADIMQKLREKYRLV